MSRTLHATLNLLILIAAHSFQTTHSSARLCYDNTIVLQHATGNVIILEESDSLVLCKSPNQIHHLTRSAL